MQLPAWHHFLLAVYTHFPPRSLSPGDCAAEAAQVQAIAAAGAPWVILRSIRRALVLYHPDKNRPAEHGQEWAAMAEELSKMASQLLARCGE